MTAAGEEAMGRVVGLHVTRTRHARPEPVDAARATPLGIEGDLHAAPGRSPNRQVLLMDAGDLRDLGLHPGDLREQVTVDLPGLMTLAAGTRLRLGAAVVEIHGPCEPCTHIGADLGVGDAEGLRERLRGRRGMLARVVEASDIRVGDPVSLAHQTAPA
ncbi:MAG: MOSC domain-containing protein [Actinomycetota bacterium]